MSDFADKVNDILSNPEALSKIMQIAQSLGVGGETAAADSVVGTEAASVAADAGSGDVPVVIDNVKPAASLGALGSLLGSGALAPLLSGDKSGEGSSDRRVALLKALKPFVTDAKRGKVDSIISAISISNTIGKFRSV